MISKKVTKNMWDKVIAHWAPKNALGSHSTHNCAFCKKFARTNGEDDEQSLCEGCPVYEYTGKKLCHDTPYHTWRYLYSKRPYPWEKFPAMVELIVAASNEMQDFLLSIREKYETKDE